MSRTVCKDEYITTTIPDYMYKCSSLITALPTFANLLMVQNSKVFYWIKLPSYLFQLLRTLDIILDYFSLSIYFCQIFQKYIHLNCLLSQKTQRVYEPDMGIWNIWYESFHWECSYYWCNASNVFPEVSITSQIYCNNKVVWIEYD